MILFMPYIYVETTLIGRTIDALTIYSENTVISIFLYFLTTFNIFVLFSNKAMIFLDNIYLSVGEMRKMVFFGWVFSYLPNQRVINPLCVTF